MASDMETTGAPPIYYATKNDHTDAMRLLLEHGANPNYVDTVSKYSTNESLLHLAASNGNGNGNADGVQLLIDYGADVHIRDCFGNSPYTCVYGNGDVAAILLKNGSNPHEIPHYGGGSEPNMNGLHDAASDGNIEYAQLMLDYGIDINTSDKHCITPFHCAAKYNHVSMMEFLIDHGADMNAIEIDWGKHAMHIAACDGSIDSMQWLLNHGIDVDIKDNGSRTSLHWASYHGKVDAVRFLISKGTDVNSMNKYGENVLFDAARSREQHREEIINILLDYGAVHVYKSKSCGPDPNEVIEDVIQSRRAKCIKKP